MDKQKIEPKIVNNKMISKFNSIICRFFAPHSQDNASYHFLLIDAQPDFSGTFHQDFWHIARSMKITI